MVEGERRVRGRRELGRRVSTTRITYNSTALSTHITLRIHSAHTPHTSHVCPKPKLTMLLPPSMRRPCSPAVTSEAAAVVVCWRGRRERPRSILQSVPFVMGGDLPPGRQHARAVRIRGCSFPRVRLGPVSGYSSCAPHRRPLPDNRCREVSSRLTFLPPSYLRLAHNAPPGVCEGEAPHHSNRDAAVPCMHDGPRVSATRTNCTQPPLVIRGPYPPLRIHPIPPPTPHPPRSPWPHGRSV